MLFTGILLIIAGVAGNNGWLIAAGIVAILGV